MMTHMFSKMLKRLAAGAAASVAVLLGFGQSSVQASTFGFDPTGNSNFQNVAVFDFAPGNALVQGIGTLLSNKANQQTTQYLQSRLGALIDGNSNSVSTPGLNSTYEITVVVGFSALANVAGNTTSYSLNSPQNPVNYFELWYDATPDSNDLAGTGFRDGTKILSGTLTDVQGSFSRFGQPAQFDQFGANNYPGVTSERVAGGAFVEANITQADPAFVQGGLGTLQLVMYNSSNITPFSQANPSALFDGIAPVLGPVNGQGADFQNQGDAAASFEVIPEPSTVLLGSLGAIGLVALIRRRTVR